MQSHSVIDATSQQLVQALMTTSHQLALNPELSASKSHLQEIIENCVEQGQDDILMSAMQRSTDIDGRLLLTERIISAAELTHVGSATAPNAAAIVFAIPMVIITDLDKAMPNRIADPQRIQQLFQNYGLINDEHAIAIHDELFAAEEINWLPSQIRHINRQLTQQAQSGISCSESNYSFRTHLTPSPEGRIVLRFLVGVVVWDDPTRQLFCSDVDQALNQARLEQWAETFKEDMNSQTGHVIWDIVMPSALSMAVSPGIYLLHAVGFFYTASSETQDHQISKALISTHGVDGIPSEIRVALFDNAEALSTVYVWPLLSDHDTKSVFEDINELLNKVNVPRVVFAAILPIIEFTGNFDRYFELMCIQLEPEKPQSHNLH
jgi:hypothetical protein